MIELPDDEAMDLGAHDAARPASASVDSESVAKLQNRLVEISRQADEGLAKFWDSNRFSVPRIEIPDFDLAEIHLPVDRAGDNTAQLVEIARAQQELLGRFVADQQEAAKEQTRRHWQTVWIAVLCTLGGASLGAVLSAALT